MTIQLTGQRRSGPPTSRPTRGPSRSARPTVVGLQVTFGSDIAMGHNLDEQGFTQDGDRWRSPGYDSADTQIEISFSGNAASFNVNPEGGCS